MKKFKKNTSKKNTMKPFEPGKKNIETVDISFQEEESILDEEESILDELEAFVLREREEFDKELFAEFEM